MVYCSCRLLPLRTVASMSRGWTRTRSTCSLLRPTAAAASWLAAVLAPPLAPFSHPIHSRPWWPGDTWHRYVISTQSFTAHADTVHLVLVTHKNNWLLFHGLRKYTTLFCHDHLNFESAVTAQNDEFEGSSHSSSSRSLMGRLRQETQYLASILTDTSLVNTLPQHKLCTRKTCTEVNFCLDVHRVYLPWQRAMTNGSDVKLSAVPWFLVLLVCVFMCCVALGGVHDHGAVGGQRKWRQSNFLQFPWLIPGLICVRVCVLCAIRWRTRLGRCRWPSQRPPCCGIILFWKLSRPKRRRTSRLPRMTSRSL